MMRRRLEEPLLAPSRGAKIPDPAGHWAEAWIERLRASGLSWATKTAPTGRMKR